MILSAGDSFATFNTPDCENAEACLDNAHAVQFISNYYSVCSKSCAKSGAGIQESVVRTLKFLNENPGVKLIFFYITMKGRYPIDVVDSVEKKLDNFRHFVSIQEMKELPNYFHSLIDEHVDTLKHINSIPKFKLDYDDIAYLSLLVNVCKMLSINIMFLSEFVPLNNDMQSLFKKEKHVVLCDSFIRNSINLDPKEHSLARLQYNHICKHYQEALAQELITRHSEFISKSLL